MTAPAQDEHSVLMEVLLEDEDAVRFIEDLAYITQVWDDLHDRDVEVSRAAVSLAFHSALVRIPSNPFVRANHHILTPLVNGMIMDWLASNELAEGSEHERSIAWAIRDNLCSLVLTCAQLIGGYEHARSVGAKIHAYGRDEPVNEYLEAKDVMGR